MLQESFEARCVLWLRWHGSGDGGGAVMALRGAIFAGLDPSPGHHAVAGEPLAAVVAVQDGPQHHTLGVLEALDGGDASGRHDQAN